MIQAPIKSCFDYEIELMKFVYFTRIYDVYNYAWVYLSYAGYIK